jgi:multidrug efflux pump subunit AcrA (membrane-fusion protein)
MGALGALSGFVAAVAALITIVYARATVLDAKQAGRERQAEHETELTQFRKLLASAEQSRTAAAESQVTLLDSQRAAIDATVRLERIRRLEGVAGALSRLADIARAEALETPMATDANGRPVTHIPHSHAEDDEVFRGPVSVSGCIGHTAAGQRSPHANNIQVHTHLFTAGRGCRTTMMW